jgi:hypothetical protein
MRCGSQAHNDKQRQCNRPGHVFVRQLGKKKNHYCPALPAQALLTMINCLISVERVAMLLQNPPMP